jgi:hypothetical protein
VWTPLAVRKFFVGATEVSKKRGSNKDGLCKRRLRRPMASRPNQRTWDATCPMKFVCQPALPSTWSVEHLSNST